MTTQKQHSCRGHAEQWLRSTTHLDPGNLDASVTTPTRPFGGHHLGGDLCPPIPVELSTHRMSTDQQYSVSLRIAFEQQPCLSESKQTD